MVLKKKKEKKTNISMQTFFFILMGLFMIWIIVFGIHKIFFVQNTLSEQNRILLQNQLKRDFAYCDDPINKGSYREIDIRKYHNIFNGVCFLGDHKLDSSKYGSNFVSETNKIKNAGDDVVLIKAPILKQIVDGNSVYKIINGNDINIISAFNVSFGGLNNSFCVFEVIPIKC